MQVASVTGGLGSTKLALQSLLNPKRLASVGVVGGSSLASAATTDNVAADLLLGVEVSQDRDSRSTT